MNQYLRESMRIPSHHIRTLRNEEATRHEILASLSGLATSADIKHDDPILIFFAGHGTEAAPPDGWPAGGGLKPRIQMLCPYDFVPRTTDNENSQGIPDFTLAVLLDKIARSKGNNIVSHVQPS